MAQLLLQQGKVIEALKYFERAAELSRTEGEIVNALSYAEATRTQLEVQEKYPSLANRLQKMGGGPMSSMAQEVSQEVQDPRKLSLSQELPGMSWVESLTQKSGTLYWQAEVVVSCSRLLQEKDR